MKNRAAAFCNVLLAWTLVWALLLAMPVTVRASSSQGTSSDASFASSAGSNASSDAASASDGSEAEGEESILAAPGQGLYKLDVEIAAEAWCLVNEDTGLVVSEKNADVPMAPASLVKMMTVMIAMEQVEKFGWDLDGTMVDTTNKTWVFDVMMDYRSTVGEPSHADIRQGETISLRELFYACLLPSANEAAMLLADYASTGNMTNFLYMMNTRAKSLGCTGTVFVDTCGLSDENTTTARDMTLICAEFMKNETLVEMAGAGTFEIAAHERHTNPYTIHATNRLMVASSPYYQAFSGIGATLVGGKTGSLGEWQNFVSKAVKNGESYLCAVLQSPNDADVIAPTQGTVESPAPRRPALYESAVLYNWAFGTLSVASALDTTQPVTELRVRHSLGQDTVRLVPSGDIKAVLHKDGDESFVKRKYSLPEYVEAPVTAGTVLGSVSLSIGAQEIGSAYLMAETDVERNTTLFAINNVKDFLSGTYFKVLMVLVLVAAAVYAGLVALVASSRRRKKQRAGAAVRQAAQRRTQNSASPAPGRGRPGNAAPPQRTDGRTVDAWQLPVESDASFPVPAMPQGRNRASKKKTGKKRRSSNNGRSKR